MVDVVCGVVCGLVAVVQELEEEVVELSREQSWCWTGAGGVP